MSTNSKFHETRNNNLSVYTEIKNTIGEDKSRSLVSSAVNHNMLLKGITECLLFSDGKYERMDMSFLINISALDYGNRYRVIVIKNESCKNPAVYEKMANDLKEKFNILFMTVWKELLICILPEKMTDAPMIMTIYHMLENQYGTVKIAASTIKGKLEESHVGLQEAIRTYDMIDTMKRQKKSLLFYEDLGIWCLLYKMDEASVFESYCSSIFQNLWTYDKNNDGNLFETLECYFENNCDKVTTASKLFIHENTLRYRLHQIEEILHKNLKDVNVIADIVTALKVRRMIQILDENRL